MSLTSNFGSVCSKSYLLKLVRSFCDCLNGQSNNVRSFAVLLPRSFQKYWLATLPATGNSSDDRNLRRRRVEHLSRAERALAGPREVMPTVRGSHAERGEGCEIWNCRVPASVPRSKVELLHGL